MRNVLFIWLGMFTLYGAFLAWHTPVKGALTLDEVAAYQSRLGASDAAGWADREGFQSFFAQDDGRPFYMLNVMELRDGPESAEADQRYGRAVVPLLLARGSYPVAGVARMQTVLDSYGGAVGQFDTVMIVRYRSRRDLLDMISSPEFQSAEPYKWASLANTLVAPSRAAPIVLLGVLVPLVLLALGGVLSATAVLASPGARRAAFAGKT